MNDSNPTPTLSLSEFKMVFKGQAQLLQLIAESQSQPIVKMTAQIKKLDAAREKEKKYRGRLFGLVLSDGHTEVTAESEPHVFEGVSELDVVEVLCMSKPTVSFRGDDLVQCAYIINAKTTNAPTLSNKVDTSLNLLKSLNHCPNRFPKDNQLVTLTLIYSSSSEARVQDDFLNSLGQWRSSIKINEVRVNLSNATEVAQAIANATDTVLAVIRGGGASNDFKSFNTPEVLQAMSSSKAYRIAGIGHSADNNLIEFVADYAATTPTDGGNHLKSELNDNHFKHQKLTDAITENKNLKRSIERLDSELRNKRPAQPQPSPTKDLGRIEDMQKTIKFLAGITGVLVLWLCILLVR